MFNPYSRVECLDGFLVIHDCVSQARHSPDLIAASVVMEPGVIKLVSPSIKASNLLSCHEPLVKVPPAVPLSLASVRYATCSTGTAARKVAALDQPSIGTEMLKFIDIAALKAVVEESHALLPPWYI